MPRSTKVFLEVCLLFGTIIGICKILHAHRSIPLVGSALPIVAAALFLYLPLLVLYLTRTRPEAWGLTLKDFVPSMRMLLLFSLLFLPGFLLLTWLYRTGWQHLPFHLALPVDWPSRLAFHLLCVALPEEVFYRGYVQSRLNGIFPRRIRVLGASLGAGWALTALLFALGHYLITPRPEALATFFPGLLFGWLRERTGGIAASTGFHALCNGTVMLVA